MQREETAGTDKKPIEPSLTILLVAFFQDLGSCTTERSKRNSIFKNSVQVRAKHETDESVVEVE